MQHIIRNTFLTILLFSIGIFSTFAQIGGQQTYQFLDLTSSARAAGLGGDFVPIKDNDINSVITNPSLITPEMNNYIALNYINYFTGPKYGYLLYSHTFNKVGSFAGSLQYMNYGKFTRADETGNITGDFTASEYALNIGWARPLGPLFSIGANGKLIYSSFDTYHSFGIAVDVAGNYASKNELFDASLIARNIGYQIVPYTAGNHEPLPFQVQLGISQRLRHIPFRFSLLYNHLEKWNLSYTDPNDPSNQKDPITGETKTRSGISKFADNFMRHIVIGGEFTIAKVLSIRLGYNYERRQEMKLYNKAGLSGFSLGVGLRIKMFEFSYARSTYMTGSINPNYFTLAVNLGGFKKK